MEIERSGVPGYEATLITLDPAEQFRLQNPQDREEVLVVQTVTVFDPPADGLVENPYFVAGGVTFVDNQPREITGTDFGVLPPHIKERLPESWRTDHARSLQGRRSTLGVLRNAHNLSPLSAVPTARVEPPTENPVLDLPAPDPVVYTPSGHHTGSYPAGGATHVPSARTP